MDSIRNRQLPGRQEALRAVLKHGDKSPAMRDLAGLREIRRAPPSPIAGVLRIQSGIDQLTPEQRAALPF